MMWEYWRKHKGKVYVTLGVFGSGYLLYKLYDSHTQHLTDLEKEDAGKPVNEELVKALTRVHFENIQKIADTTTLPHAMVYLSGRIEKMMDLSHLAEKINKGNGIITLREKVALWDRFKVQSFARTVLSIWSMTSLSLYIRVLVKILGRHFYIDTARGLGAAHLEESERIDRNDEQQFLAGVDFLSNCGMSLLISNMQIAVAEVLKEKSWIDSFTASLLHDTIMQILDVFMSMGNPHQWVNYLMSEDLKTKSAAFSSNDGQNERTKFGLLMLEAHTVLSSDEFRSILDVSLRSVVDDLVQDMKDQHGDLNSSEMPLSKLVQKVAKMGPLLLEESCNNKYIQMVRNLPVAEAFFTLQYADTPL